MSPHTSLPRHVQGPNAWLDIVACDGAYNIRPALQCLDSKRHRFSVGAGLALSDGLGRPLQDFNVVLFGLLTEPNSPSLPHAPVMVLEAKDAK